MSELVLNVIGLGAAVFIWTLAGMAMIALKEEVKRHFED